MIKDKFYIFELRKIGEEIKNDDDAKQWIKKNSLTLTLVRDLKSIGYVGEANALMNEYKKTTLRYKKTHEKHKH